MIKPDSNGTTKGTTAQALKKRYDVKSHVKTLSLCWIDYGMALQCQVTSPWPLSQSTEFWRGLNRLEAENGGTGSL